MENITIGDELWDRDTRRVGRKLKVIWVDQDSVTAEVIADSINSKKSTVGNGTDIARDRLKKGYTLHKTLTSVDLSKTKGTTTISDMGYVSNRGFEPAADDDIVDDPSSLEDALNSAGYFWLPPVEDLLAAVAPDAPATTKTGLVHLIHNIIRESLVTGQ